MLTFSKALTLTVMDGVGIAILFADFEPLQLRRVANVSIFARIGGVGIAILQAMLVFRSSSRCHDPRNSCRKCQNLSGSGVSGCHPGAVVVLGEATEGAPESLRKLRGGKTRSSKKIP